MELWVATVGTRFRVGSRGWGAWTDLAAQNAGLQGVADARAAAAGQVEVLDEGIDRLPLGGGPFAQRALELGSVQEHLFHGQHVHQRICAAAFSVQILGFRV